jgi:NAD-dependent DNA ligase
MSRGSFLVPADEQEELKALLCDLVGEPEDFSGTMNDRGRLPFDDPPPTVFFENKEFVFTGIFAFGKRDRCAAEVTARAGRFSNNVTSRTDYLVVGMIASPDWVQSTHGRKIEAAVEIREAGRRPISIISEEHWIVAMQADAH